MKMIFLKPRGSSNDCKQEGKGRNSTFTQGHCKDLRKVKAPQRTDSQDQNNSQDTEALNENLIKVSISLKEDTN